jgi:hypothetical protein
MTLSDGNMAVVWTCERSGYGWSQEKGLHVSHEEPHRVVERRAGPMLPAKPAGLLDGGGGSADDLLFTPIMIPAMLGIGAVIKLYERLHPEAGKYDAMPLRWQAAGAAAMIPGALIGMPITVLMMAAGVVIAFSFKVIPAILLASILYLILVFLPSLI